MIVVSDTSALINLAAVGQLDLLRQLYGRVLIPTAVRAEILSKADLLLLDERRARQVAANLGVKVAGLIGVLLEAKHRRLLPAVKPVLDALIRQAGFWISHTLYDRTLQVAGE